METYWNFHVWFTKYIHWKVIQKEPSNVTIAIVRESLQVPKRMVPPPVSYCDYSKYIIAADAKTCLWRFARVMQFCVYGVYNRLNQQSEKWKLQSIIWMHLLEKLLCSILASLSTCYVFGCLLALLNFLWVSYPVSNRLRVQRELFGGLVEIVLSVKLHYFQLALPSVAYFTWRKMPQSNVAWHLVAASTLFPWEPVAILDWLSCLTLDRLRLGGSSF